MFSRAMEKEAKKQKHNAVERRRQSIPSSTLTSSSSEVSTPPTAFTSPITSHKPMSHLFHDDKSEIDDWLENMALFRAGANALTHPNTQKGATTIITTTTTTCKSPQPPPSHNDALRALIETATKPLPSTSAAKSNNKRRRVDAEKYKLHVQIDKLLQQKSPEELYTLLSTKNC
ncbi:hypothetical protein MBANPS3_007282 [Mucor bainieri]